MTNGLERFNVCHVLGPKLGARCSTHRCCFGREDVVGRYLKRQLSSWVIFVLHVVNGCVSYFRILNFGDTVDGSELRLYNQLRLVVYPVIFRVLYIPGGCLGFLSSTVP